MLKLLVSLRFDSGHNRSRLAVKDARLNGCWIDADIHSTRYLFTAISALRATAFACSLKALQFHRHFAAQTQTGRENPACLLNTLWHTLHNAPCSPVKPHQTIRLVTRRMPACGQHQRFLASACNHHMQPQACQTLCEPWAIRTSKAPDRRQKAAYQGQA